LVTKLVIIWMKAQTGFIGKNEKNQQREINEMNKNYKIDHIA